MPARSHSHDHDHGDARRHRRDDAELALSVMAQSALARVGGAVFVLAFMWLAVLWAIALP